MPPTGRETSVPELPVVVVVLGLTVLRLVWESPSGSMPLKQRYTCVCPGIPVPGEELDVLCGRAVRAWMLSRNYRLPTTGLGLTDPCQSKPRGEQKIQAVRNVKSSFRTVKAKIACMEPE